MRKFDIENTVLSLRVHYTNNNKQFNNGAMENIWFIILECLIIDSDQL